MGFVFAEGDQEQIGVRFNRALDRTIITKYGTKRGAIALGRALPFGIGAVTGGCSN